MHLMWLAKIKNDRPPQSVCFLSRGLQVHIPVASNLCYTTHHRDPCDSLPTMKRATTDIISKALPTAQPPCQRLELHTGKVIVGLAGPKFVGKTTAALHLERRGFKRLSFADPLKSIVSTVFCWTDECHNPDKKEVMTSWGITPRQAMQRIGTDVFRNQLDTLFPTLNMKQSSIWIEHMARRIAASRHNRIVIDDVRFDDESKMITDMGGVVIRLRFPPTLTSKKKNEPYTGSMAYRAGMQATGKHESEVGVALWDYDVVSGSNLHDDMDAIISKLLA